MTINCASYPNSPYDTCYGDIGSGINDMTKMHYEPKNSYLNIPLQEIVFDRDLSSLDSGNVETTGIPIISLQYLSYDERSETVYERQSPYIYSR